MSSHGEIENIKIDLPSSNVNGPTEGRLTGRANSQKEQQLSKSMAETSINRFKDKEEDSDMYETPITVESKANIEHTPQEPPASE
jgi:hypothetical protein